MGLGRRVFSPGEVLTASNTMNYLMDQTVMNFAGTAARGSAIGTAVAEGMVSYINDTDSLEVYDGSAWKQFAYSENVINPGLVPVVPSTVATSAGTATIADTGLVSFTTGTSNIRLNDVFTSSFNDYIIKISAIPSQNGTLTLRFSTGGTDNTGSNYTFGYSSLTSSGLAFTAGGGSSNIATVGATNTNGFSYSLNVANPASTSIYKQITHTGVSSLTSISGFVGNTLSATAFDGINLAVAGGTMTGYIQVFGFRK